MPALYGWTRRNLLKLLGAISIPVPAFLSVEYEQLPSDLDSSRVTARYGLGFRVFPDEETSPDLIARMAFDLGESMEQDYWRHVAAVLKEHYGNEVEQKFWNEVIRLTTQGA